MLATTGIALALLRALLEPPATEGGGLALAWDAPPSCPDRAAIDSEIAQTLGGTAVDRPFAAAMAVIPIDGGFRISIAIEDAGVQSQRVLEGSDCAALASAAALIVAMTIDPRAAARSLEPPTSDKDTEEPVRATVPEPEPEPEAETEPEPELEAEAEADPEPLLDATPREADQPRARALQWTGRAGFGVGGGPLPRAPSGVATIAVGIRGAKWRAEAVASYWTPREGAADENPGVGVRAQLWTVGVRGCGIVVFGPILELPLCATAQVGRMHATGTGPLFDSLAAASPWAAAGAGPELIAWLRPRFGLGLAAEGHVALARTEFTTEPSGRAHRASAVGGSLGLVVEFRAP